MKIRCVIVDDEPLAIQLMQSYAAKVPFLEVLKSFSSPADARSFLEQEAADLVFMDINMPDLSGIDLLKGAPETLCVFCTAYPDFALTGYELGVVDYLVKPFSFDRFLKAACKAQELLLQKNAYNNKQQHTGPEEPYLFVRAEYSLVKINVKEIVLLEGLKDYIKIHTIKGTKPILTLQSLRALEEKLPKPRFCRVHKSFLINIDHLTSVQKNYLHIAGREIPIGNQYKEFFLQIIANHTPH